MQTRKEYLDWAKQRAIEYVQAGDIPNAWTSFVSDLANDERTNDHPAIMMGNQLLFGGLLSTKEQMKEFIEGTN